MNKMQERRYDLDWLRVIAIVLLHLFHCAMPFAAESGWHLKNDELSNLVLECNFFLSRWRMPLLFFISGVGTVFVLNQLSIQQYAWQRTKRLLFPLLFGMLVVVPPQVYFERIYKKIAYTSYFDFYPSIFTTGAYPIGNFSWHHLWFVAYLFLFSLVSIPIFIYLRSPQGAILTDKVALFSAKVGLYWFALLLYLGSALLIWYPEETHAIFDDWATFTKYLLYFLFGFFIGVNPIFWSEIETNRRTYLKVAFFSTLAINYFRWNNVEPDWGLHAANLLYWALLILSAWTWILSILGYAKAYLNFNNRFLAIANEGIYPFYILHQTFIVMIAYYVLQVHETIASKYFFLTLTSFVLSIGCYMFLVKPYKITRFLFGMKT